MLTVLIYIYCDFRDNFEEETDKFFTNDPNNQDTTWILGSGDELLKGKSPAFDHTLLTDKGLCFYFLFLRISHRP